MEKRVLGTTNIRISPIIMGTWQAGKSMWAGIDDRETSKAMRTAFEEGITMFDTAEAYGNGHSERIIAGALHDVRDQVVYADKVFSNHLRYDQVMEACHRSLKNLNTDYIDLYYIHWPSGSFGAEPVPIGETLKAMNDLKDQGKIRAIGVSNFSGIQLEEAAGYGRIDCLQPPYSLFWRHVETDALPYCKAHHITVCAYSSMAQGILTGKFEPGHKFSKGDHRFRNRLLKGENFTRVQSAIEKLKPIAKRYNITLGQLALAWTIAQPQTCAIAGARNADQVKENVKAAEIRLSQADLSIIGDIGRMVTDHLDDNPVLWG
ncbi:MAG: aldo/keto reductase [Desulfobacterales bacterium]|nr:aldo/keto reductase [Desulfobacterales bacterium]MDD4071797.1 aldo/keto reductase [Desulfobacterales bacterium]MDD4393405.1 aldo/keto reductase [Desulfobacterales bacterium]